MPILISPDVLIEETCNSGGVDILGDETLVMS